MLTAIATPTASAQGRKILGRILDREEQKAVRNAAIKLEGTTLTTVSNYLGYFELFNAQLFYEAHDVLEELWLPIRREPQGDFYKGLIQLAGAFVHLQKNRLRPAAALFKLARTNFMSLLIMLRMDTVSIVV